MATKNDLLLNQQQRRSDGLTEDADKIDNFISRLDDLLALKRPWTLVCLVSIIFITILLSL